MSSLPVTLTDSQQIEFISHIELFRERKILYEAIKLCESLHIKTKIFKIIKSHNEQYTINSNGIFFDLNTISDKAVEQIKLLF